MSNFVHLHNHSDASFLDGLSKVKDIVAKAKELDHSAIALTDHGNCNNWIPFYKEAKKQGVKPILGCLLPGQPIYTEDGIKNVEDIEKGDYVLTHQGGHRKVLNTMSRIHDGDFYTIELSDNSGSLVLTDEHPVLVADHNGNRSWLKPGDIKDGVRNKVGGIKNWNSYVCFPKYRDRVSDLIYLTDYLPNKFDTCQNSDGFHYIVKAKKSNKYDSPKEWKNIYNQVELTQEFGYFLGLFVAEGSFGTYPDGSLNGDIVLSFNIAEREYVDFVKEFVKNDFDIEVQIYDRPKKSITEIHFGCQPLAYFLSRACGKGAHNKKVPDFIYRSSRDVKSAFILGLVDGDGKNGERNSIKVSSRGLAYGFKRLIAENGFFSKVLEGTGTLNGNQYTYYYVNYSPNRQYARSLEDDDFIYKPIKSITSFYDRRYVYNFEVAEDNSYVSDFVLHNCEAYIVEDCEAAREAKQRTSYHVVLLAMNNVGYQNIIGLMTEANKNFYYKPRIDLKLLEQHHEGIICLTACMNGVISSHLYDQIDNEDRVKNAVNLAMARVWTRKLQAIFGDRLYFEVMDHGIPEQKQINKHLRELSAKFGVPTVATFDCHYINKDDAVPHDYLKQISRGVKSYSRNGDSGGFSTHEFYIRSRNEMSELDLTEEEKDRTLEIASRCNVELELGKYRLPKYPHDGEESSEELLKQKLRIGWSIKLTQNQKRDSNYIERAKKELDEILDADLADYFLIVADIVNHARKNNWTSTAGRGSCAGSLSAYLLNITTVDPIRYHLVWERFYNAGRKGSMPDIDVDVEQRYRADVIQYIKDRFGHDKVVQVATYNELSARSVLKKVFKVAGISFDEANRITSLVPLKNEEHVAVTLDEALKMSKPLREYEEKYKPLFAVAKQLEGCYESIGTHAAAVLISDKSVHEVVPLCKGPQTDDLISSWDMYAAEEVGMLKIDILGLKTLDIIHKTLDQIKTNHDVEINLYKLPEKDDKVTELLASGRLEGIFQLQKQLGKVWSKRLVPQTVEDISHLTSLLRPGCLDLKIPDEYKDNKFSGIKPQLVSSSLENILAPTYYVSIFQEQLLEICKQIAGMNLKEADNVRKATGKKKPEDMKKYKNLFIQGCISHSGLSVENSEKLWELIEKSAGYSFNASHAISYSVITYRTAYLKAYYPLEFYLACMSTCKDMDEIRRFIDDAKIGGISVVNPSLQQGNVDFSSSGDSIIFGLSHIKNVGKNVFNKLNKFSRIKSFDEFLKRLIKHKLNQQVVTALIGSGALDFLQKDRSLMNAVYNLYSQLSDLERQAYCDSGLDLVTFLRTVTDESRVDHNKNLFGRVPNVTRRRKIRGFLLDYDKMDKIDDLLYKLGLEKFYLNVTLSGHETDLYKRMRGSHCCADIVKGLPDDIQVSLCVLVEGCREIVTKTNKDMAFLTGSDKSGLLDSIVVFPELYESSKHLLSEGRILNLRGRVSDRGGIICQKINVVK